MLPRFSSRRKDDESHGSTHLDRNQCFLSKSRMGGNCQRSHRYRLLRPANDCRDDACDLDSIRQGLDAVQHSRLRSCSSVSLPPLRDLWAANARRPNSTRAWQGRIRHRCVGRCLCRSLRTPRGRWEDCVERPLHVSPRDIWSMAHRCELAVIRGPSSLAEMVWNDRWIRACAYRGLLGRNHLCLFPGLARYTPTCPRDYEGSDFPCQYFFSSASPHLFLHGCCHTTTLDDTDRLSAAQEKATCLRIKRFRFDIRPETLRSMISFRRSTSCTLERCSSNSLSCAITSAFNPSIIERIQIRQRDARFMAINVFPRYCELIHTRCVPTKPRRHS
jgi:hypothetical protein